MGKESRALDVVCAVNRVDAVNHRNAETCFFRRGFLNLSDYLVPAIECECLVGDVEDRSHAVLDDSPIQFRRIDLDRLIPSLRDRVDGELGHLTNFFFQRHALEQVLDLPRMITVGVGATCALKEFVTIDERGRCLGFNGDQWLENEAQ